MDIPRIRPSLQHPVLLFVIVLVLVLAGCAQNAPYHTTSGTPGNCTTDPEGQSCRQSYYQEHPNFDLAFAEFSERGNAFSESYVTEVKNRIARKANDEGVVLVVFVHGWKHNAAETDDNLISFKSSLESIDGFLKKGHLGKRNVVGLYIGWRGASIETKYLEQITFWDRKAVAEEVGKGGVTRLLLQLDEITRGDGKNVMVVIGHSFGGAIVTSALSEVLTERVVNRTSSRNYAPPLGDGVIVINPALEANQSLNLVEAAIQDEYQDEQHPLFVSLSTDADDATHYAFPAGQTIGLLATWRQAELQRSYYRDRSDLDTEIPLQERHLDATTLGNFAPFLTHRLTASEQGGQVAFSFDTCEQDWDGCKPRGWTSLTGHPTVHPRPDNYPLYFIKTNDSLMTGHNDIFNPRVKAFLVTVIDDVVSRSLSPRTHREKGGESDFRQSILNDKNKLESRVLEVLQVIQDKEQ